MTHVTVVAVSACKTFNFRFPLSFPCPIYCTVFNMSLISTHIKYTYLGAVKTLTGCWASVLTLCDGRHLRQSNTLIILSRVHSSQLWLPRHNGRVQLGTSTAWILTLSIAEFGTGTTWGSDVEVDLYCCLKPYLEIAFSLMKDLGKVDTNIKKQQCSRLSIYEILGECGNKLSLNKEFRAFSRVK
jgi:hypothetical protein